MGQVHLLVYNVTGSPMKPLVVHVSINKAEVAMEVDTGTSASIISEETYNRLWSKDNALQLKQSDVKLRTYSGEQLTIKWSIDVTVQYNEQIS